MKVSRDKGLWKMDFDLKWVNPSGDLDEGELREGTTRISGDCIIDALERFFKDNGNAGKRIVSAQEVYEQYLTRKWRNQNESDN